MDEDMRNLMNTLNYNVANLIGRFDTHIANPTIHQVPPCDSHKALVCRLWAVAVLAVTSLSGVVYGFLR